MNFSEIQPFRACFFCVFQLGMLDLADDRIGLPGYSKALSGGERKRLSFASEVEMSSHLLQFSPMLISIQFTSSLNEPWAI